MISLNKIRLINWHLFSNENVNVGQTTFLTGANGTGKSTIIDALQVVLLGDTSSRNFNKAANEKSSRNILSYLRGDTGETQNGEVKCLRKGIFSSYIVLQFFDDVRNGFFTIGIVFDVFPDETFNHNFFYFKGMFNENDFLLNDETKKRPLTTKEFKSFLKETNKEFVLFESNVAYQEFIKETFGSLPNKYFSLFKKAVSFTPITNISNFITDFVCDIDYKIDIAPMKKNIEQYKLLELEAKTNREKADKLITIQKLYNEFKDLHKTALISDYFVDRTRNEINLKQLNTFRKKAEENSSKIKEIKDILDEYNSDLSILEKKKNSYFGKKLGLDDYSAYVTLDNEKNSIDGKIQDIDKTFEDINSFVIAFNNSLKESLNSFINRINGILPKLDELNLVARIRNYLNEVSNSLTIMREADRKCESGQLTSESFDEYWKKINSFMYSSINLCALVENTLEEKRNNEAAIRRELIAMQTGEKPYPSRLIEIVRELQDALSSRHPNAKVYIYADLIDIIDKRWIKAIEAAIYGQKFNLFVDEEYFEEADSILKTIIDRNFYRIAIVDSEKLIERNFKAKENSVAEVIQTTHSGARAYTNLLLGSIIRCETFQEARECGSGLLPDCTGYRSFSTWYLNKTLGNVNFIGTSLGSDNVEVKTNELNVLSSEMSLLTNLWVSLREISSAEFFSKNEHDGYCSFLSTKEKKRETLCEQKESIVSEFNDSSSKEMLDLDEQIKNIEEDIKEILSKKEELIKEIGRLENENRIIVESSIPSLLESKETTMDSLKEKYGKDFVEECAEPKFLEIKDTMPFEEIVHQADMQKKACLAKAENVFKNVTNLRNEYNALYNIFYDSSSRDSNKEYDNELELITSIELPRYEEQIAQAKENAIKEFKDDFIYKLRTSIETVHSQIGELNDALKDAKFGKDSYRFVATPNKDFIEYYNMITSDLLFDQKTKNNEFTEKYQHTIESLFDLISYDDEMNNSQKSQILQNVEKFTDFRTYLNFDLLVKKGESNIESSLSRTIKKQSGGETQTPFYIAILASFAQLFRVNNINSNTLRLIIFDEAFSKMDSMRIKEVISLMKQFGLQVILSTPTEKIRDLVDSVDVILVTMHNIKKEQSYIDIYKELNKTKASLA